MPFFKYLLLISFSIYALTGANRIPTSINIVFHQEIEKSIEKIKRATGISREVRIPLIKCLKKLENADWGKLVPEISGALDDREVIKFSLLATQKPPPVLKPFDRSYGVAMSFLKTVIKAGLTDEGALGDLALVISDAFIKLDNDVLSEETAEIVRYIYNQALSIALITALNDANISNSTFGAGTGEQSSRIIPPKPPI